MSEIQAMHHNTGERERERDIQIITILNHQAGIQACNIELFNQLPFSRHFNRSFVATLRITIVLLEQWEMSRACSAR
jgi:hypothetical protein